MTTLNLPSRNHTTPRRLSPLRLLLLTACAAVAQHNIAVMELEGTGIDTNEVTLLAARVRTELFKTGKYTVLERSRVDEILKEQGFQQKGCTNADCAVEVGQLLNVSSVVLGTAGRAGPVYTIDLRMVDVATGAITAMAAEDCDGCDIGGVLRVALPNAVRTLAALPRQVATATPASTKPAPQASANNLSVQKGLTASTKRRFDNSGFDTFDHWLQFRRTSAISVFLLSVAAPVTVVAAKGHDPVPWAFGIGCGVGGLFGGIRALRLNARHRKPSPLPSMSFVGPLPGRVAHPFVLRADSDPY